MGKKRYSAAFRIRAIDLAEELGTHRAAAILGVTARSLQQWKQLPLSGEAMKEVEPELRAALLEVDEAKKEVKRLKKENEELKTANLILREISTVFSKDLSNPSLGRSLNSNSKR